jgi:hypothetical protein
LLERDVAPLPRERRLSSDADRPTAVPIHRDLLLMERRFPFDPFFIVS